MTTARLLATPWSVVVVLSSVPESTEKVLRRVGNVGGTANKRRSVIVVDWLRQCWLRSGIRNRRCADFRRWRLSDRKLGLKARGSKTVVGGGVGEGSGRCVFQRTEDNLLLSQSDESLASR